MSPAPAAVAVVVPARDEQGLVEGCLRSVLLALDAVPLPSVVVLVAHRCADRTPELAAAVLGSRGLVVSDDAPHVVGARRRGMDCATACFKDVDPAALWLFSTDADSRVPPSWVVDALDRAGREAAAVAGTTELDGWPGTAPGWRRYRALVAEKVSGATHQHAYAANLAVRADAYRDAGGWPDVPHGEDRALLANLVARGHRVERPTGLVVVTSGRRRGRAPGGLADLIAGLES